MVPPWARDNPPGDAQSQPAPFDGLAVAGSRPGRTDRKCAAGSPPGCPGRYWQWPASAVWPTPAQAEGDRSFARVVFDGVVGEVQQQLAQTVAVARHGQLLASRHADLDVVRAGEALGVGAGLPNQFVQPHRLAGQRRSGRHRLWSAASGRPRSWPGAGLHPARSPTAPVAARGASDPGGPFPVRRA